MKKYVIGNWKCYKTTDDGLAWFRQFAKLYRANDKVEVVVAPPFLSLENISRELADLKLSGISLAAQDVSPFPRGSYTGAIAADMIRGLASYVIVGHSERRRYFHETVQDVINKVTEVADCGLTPIVCVEDADLLSQLRPLADVDCKELIVAYTPVDALNFNIPESVGKVTEAITMIRNYFPVWPIVYGGALTMDNAQEYLDIPGLSGLFLGSTSREADKFGKVCQYMRDIVER